MKLYYSPGACSLAVHIVLQETGLPFVLERVDLATHETEQGGDYYRVNPKGAVPTLELDDGTRLTEGPVINQYLCDLAGRVDLMPEAGSLARYRVMEWQNYVTSELHKTAGALFDSQLEADARARFASAVTQRLSWVSQQLQGRSFLTGEVFTAADAYLFVVAGWAPHLGLHLAACVELQDFLKRVAARPAVQAALKAEGLAP
ncbi:glutathione transferase GstA [Pseudomonas lalucatii]|uniref:Glutathione transferase GstA n=1 Tax=Pseudomonas lalucatii TaxID=1424203 RepID=A0ABS5Q6S6_9PSED|nr:glutathione transferase GstA [Pseudomonas lalucatii]MBS7664303.1 glutathione transferase GstA [Pseudomonas lalucatii]QVM86515.1 glutathione transferase GstA [Pseudomonas lalucatii]